jgi:6,7-dimethyl-8-ribityllumazine synthase
MKKDITSEKFVYSGGGARIAIVYSRFNSFLVEELLKETVSELEKLKTSEIKTYSVPGALEIPLTAKKIIKTKKFDLMIALGIVIEGETYHFKHVSEESIRGITNVSLETEKPIISGILTVKSEKQAKERITRGKEFARSAVHILNTLNNI